MIESVLFLERIGPHVAFSDPFGSPGDGPIGATHRNGQRCSGNAQRQQNRRLQQRNRGVGERIIVFVRRQTAKRNIASGVA